MKKFAFLAAALMALVGPAASSYAASAPPQIAYTGFRCVARSPVAIGVWVHTDLNVARIGALQQCAARTPAHQSCFIVGPCQWGTWTT